MPRILPNVWIKICIFTKIIPQLRVYLLTVIVSITELQHFTQWSSKHLQKIIFGKLTISQIVKKSWGLLKNPKAYSYNCIQGTKFESHAQSTNTASKSSVLLKCVEFTYVCLCLLGYKICALYIEAITCRPLIFQDIIQKWSNFNSKNQVV